MENNLKEQFICEQCGAACEGEFAPCGAECCDDCCEACYYAEPSGCQFVDNKA